MIAADISGLIEQFRTIKDLAQTSCPNVEDRAYLTEPEKVKVRVAAGEFNDAVLRFNTMANNAGSTFRLSPINVPTYFFVWESVEALTKMRVGCSKALGFLEKMAAPALSKYQIDTLGSLREEISKIEANYERNLSKAIEEYEQGHYLASAMIASRVIIYCLNKIPGQTDEDKISHLTQHEVFDKERKDLGTSVLKASRLARNFLSHNIGIFPDPDEALSVLAESVRIAKLIDKMGQN